MFNEDNTVEQMLIEAATQSSWQYVKSQDIPRSSDSVLVESWLLEALVRLNPITRQQAEQVIYKLRAAITCGGNYDELVTANDRFRTLLFNENTEPFGKDGEYIPIRFFSEDAVEDYCVVTNQWEFPRSSVEGGKRLDLVYLINGIPVCVGEAKSPVRPQITWADGAIDMLHYEKSIPEMFVPNILTFATEGKELQYAGICAPVDKWGPWFNDESRQHGTIESVKSNVMGLVQPNRLLDIYRYYSVFTGTSSGKKIKIVCRYQQYIGGEAIVQRVLNTYREKQGPKKGLIWHFQGSGKSWLMVFAAQKLRLQNELHAPTVVIVDDRIDLEDQITGDFTRADIPNIESAKTKDDGTLDNYPLNVTILRSCKSAKSISDYIDECFDNALNNVFITDTAKKESVGIILEIINSEDITEDTKRKYLSGQQNKVSLSDVNNIQWEFAIEVDIVIPAWPEIYAFYESQNNVMISSLRIFITKHIDELTDISELDDTQKELLAHSALLTSDFEILVYDKLVKIFDGVTFKDADINSVDNAHFKSLLCADMLPYSTYYTTTIRDNHSDVLTYYVDKYLDECIIEIEELPTDMRLYKHLMKNPRVIGEKALSVVQHFLPHIVWDNELANITLPVLKNNIEKFDYDIEKNILVASTNLPERLSFLIDLVEKFRDDFDIVTELIESLGDSYRSITDKSKKATIENNHMNEMLLGKLKTIGYISSYREDDDKLRVSHKRNH